MSDDRSRRDAAGDGLPAPQIPDLLEQMHQTIEELLHENRRLAFRIESEERIASLSERKREVDERLAEIRQENGEFQSRVREAEATNGQLVNLYVAAHMLHSSLDLPSVLSSVQQITVNLLGAEVFVIYLLDEAGERLVPAAAEGAELGEFASVVLGSGIVGRCVLNREIFREEASDSDDRERPIACIPLCVRERPIGAIAIHRRLAQKTSFTKDDNEMFRLLAGHAATALFGARLYTASVRRIDAIRRMIQVLSD